MEEKDHLNQQDSDDFGLPISNDRSEDPYEREDFSAREKETESEEEARYNREDGHRWDRDYESKKEKSSAGPVIALVVLLLLAGGAVWFFFIREGEPSEPIVPAETIVTPPQPKDNLVDPEPVAEEPQPVPEPEPETGEIRTISGPTGRYFVVVSSSIDDDLALDMAKKLSNEGVSSTIIEPNQDRKFYRLAVADFDSWNHAVNKMEELQTTFGQEIWVLKY